LSRTVEVIKGFFIGIANIMPSVSGGTLAVILKVYDKLINGVNDLLNSPFKVIRTLFFYIVGVFIGVIVAIVLIDHLYQTNPLPITFLFLGFIIGGIPLVYKEAKKAKIKSSDYLFFIIAFTMVIILPFLGSGNEKVITFSVFNVFFLFFLGAMLAPTVLIPGVSGSVLLMSFGYYETLMSLFSTFLRSLVSLDFKNATEAFLLSAPFAFGIIFGVLATSRVIKYLLTHARGTTYIFILGLTVAAPFPILYHLETFAFMPLIWVFSLMLFVLGFYMPNYLEKLNNHQEIKNFDSNLVLKNK